MKDSDIKQDSVSDVGESMKDNVKDNENNKKNDDVGAMKDNWKAIERQLKDKGRSKDRQRARGAKRGKDR